VSTLGVLPAARRRGIALALLTQAFAAFQARGLERAGLWVDAESTTGAIELYRRAGMHVVERSDSWELRR
jgi:ribosomal protein S18 acetylase RimI-like enzyme